MPWLNKIKTNIVSNTKAFFFKKAKVERQEHSVSGLFLRYSLEAEIISNLDYWWKNFCNTYRIGNLKFIQLEVVSVPELVMDK